MRRIALTICAVLGLQAGTVWAATDIAGAPTAERTAVAPIAPAHKPAARAGTASNAPTPTPSASVYAAREKANPQLTRFKGGGTSLYIGGSTLVIVLLVVLLIVLL